jgi:hypothetical protein
MLSITLKIAVEAPIPSAKVTTATTAKPGAFRKFLSAYRTSCPKVPIFAPHPIDIGLLGLQLCRLASKQLKDGHLSYAVSRH